MTPTALSHLRVLDLTRVRAGPTCCRVLADFSADVVKVDAPEGVDPNAGINGPPDGFDMLNLHRSKRSLTLNFKTGEGWALFAWLVAGADVVVENFRPDVKEPARFRLPTLAAANPRIILASISGFGQEGPYARRAGFDQIAQGMGGLMAVTGLEGQGPMRAGAAVADFASGLYAAIGVLIALAERERSGRGQWVHTSLLEAQIAMMDFQAVRYLVDGDVPGQAGNDHPVSTPMGGWSRAPTDTSTSASAATRSGGAVPRHRPRGPRGAPRFRHCREAPRQPPGGVGDLAADLRQGDFGRRARASRGGEPGRSTGWTRLLPIRRSSRRASPHRSAIRAAAISASSASHCTCRLRRRR